LTLSSAGAITGTPSSATNCTFTARATNAAGNATQSLSVTVNPAPNPIGGWILRFPVPGTWIWR
jgi:uncharacterized membrane protein